MKIRFFAFVLLAFSITVGCSQGQNATSLSAKAFSDKITNTPGATVLDVRTPEEFAGGHIAKASNVDWRSGHFEHQVMSLDKSKAVFVYCLSGGRSSSAAKKMRSMGFKEVYELDGGLNQWQAARLPITK